MAYRIIPHPAGGRSREVKVTRDLVIDRYGVLRQYGPCPHANPIANIPTGGSWMEAILGPDLGDGQVRGSATNTTSLDPTISLMNGYSTKSWKAGHLLNAEFGGSGILNDNLTPLTAAANAAHKTFEQHIKRMLVKCHQIDGSDKQAPHWYGVWYRVDVDSNSYATAPAPADMHSYAYSHISIRYRFVKLPKFPPNVAAHLGNPPPNTCNTVAVNDPHYQALRSVTLPAFAPSPNIANWVAQPVEFSVEIHNEP